jgi:hypothetical protein
MDPVDFRRNLDRVDPALKRLLELLESLPPTSPQVMVRTCLTCDTVDPWGKENAELERHPYGMYQGK